MRQRGGPSTLSLAPRTAAVRCGDTVRSTGAPVGCGFRCGGRTLQTTEAVVEAEASQDGSSLWSTTWNPSHKQKEMDVSPVPTISYVKDFNCHIGTTICF